MTITELVKESYDIAEAKGFHKEPINIGEKLMLIVSELGEALEAHRSGRMVTGPSTHLTKLYSEHSPVSGHTQFEVYIKDSFEDELADVMIRVADLCGILKIDLETHVKAKMRYNKSRPYKHDKEY